MYIIVFILCPGGLLCIIVSVSCCAGLSVHYFYKNKIHVNQTKHITAFHKVSTQTPD